MIEEEINLVIKEGRENVLVNEMKAKKVAKMLAELSTYDKSEPDALSNQYIAGIKNICNS